VLAELWHQRHLDIAEQPGGMLLPDVVAAEPGPHLRDVATTLLQPGERGIEVPVDRPVRGNIRGDLFDDGEHRVLILLATRLLDSAVLHEGERSAGDKYVSGPLPADLGVNPVKRRRAEHGPELPGWNRRVLEPGVHEFHLSSTRQVLRGQC